MTNAEKYLKDGVDIKEFSRNMFNYLVNRDEPLKIKIENYLQEDIKPTLTEDERVILRNMPAKEWNYIFRDNMGNIQFEHLKSNGTPSSIGRADWYNHLFQFIKERKRIRDKRIIRR